jgi:hypothetical protein
LNLLIDIHNSTFQEQETPNSINLSTLNDIYGSNEALEDEFPPFHRLIIRERSNSIDNGSQMTLGQSFDNITGVSNEEKQNGFGLEI